MGGLLVDDFVAIFVLVRVRRIRRLHVWHRQRLNTSFGDRMEVATTVVSSHAPLAGSSERTTVSSRGPVYSWALFGPCCALGETSSCLPI